MDNGIGKRRIRIHTTEGIIDGALKISPVLRTLDELNIGSRDFLTVLDVQSESPGWKIMGPQVSINRSTILFIHELDNPPRSSAKRVGGTFARASVRLSIAGYVVEGFIHVPPGGVALKRLNQLNHPFLSLTSVSVTGKDETFAAPFLAINHAQILAAQESPAEQPLGDELEMNFELTPRV